MIPWFFGDDPHNSPLIIPLCHEIARIIPNIMENWDYPQDSPLIMSWNAMKNKPALPHFYLDKLSLFFLTWKAKEGEQFPLPLPPFRTASVDSENDWAEKPKTIPVLGPNPWSLQSGCEMFGMVSTGDWTWIEHG